ncbi:hypothetical protein CLV78_10375 [Aliiruegeria haliotis]|uniref:Uncharacterized protein n=1 Tax=Aliiruegeria haliotis TaxID=1280846 RepID=A0A2T0RSS4_9RHOB|nr:hypothetical protein [Aliiruegeria haliotis]PRY24211.1 hypothetical protein CLV78_10375 [Aliiruegeria haliotis]
MTSAKAAVVTYDEGLSDDALPVAKAGIFGIAEPVSSRVSRDPLVPGTANLVTGSIGGGRLDELNLFSFPSTMPWGLNTNCCAPVLCNAITRSASMMQQGAFCGQP